MAHGNSHHSAHGAPGGHPEVGHIIPYRIYVTVLLVLLVLTVVTVAVSRIDFGVLNIVVAMVIASIKAGLVGLFFMHLKYEDRTIWIFVLFPIVLLFTLIAGLFVDNPFRWIP